MRTLTPPSTSSPSASRVTPAGSLLHTIDRHRYRLIAVIGLLYLLGFNGQWRIGDDSAGYLNIAQAIIQGEISSHDEALHRYPGLPLLLAGTFVLAGPEAFWLATLLMLILALTTLALVYRTIALHDSRPVGMLITLMVATSAMFAQHAYELLADLPFLFGVMLFLAGYEEARTRSRGHMACPEPIAPSSGVRPNRWRALLFMAAGLAVMLLTRRTALVFLAAAAITGCGLLLRGTSRNQQYTAAVSMAPLLTAALLWLNFLPRAEDASLMRDLMLPHLARHSIAENAARFASHAGRIFEGDAGRAVFGLALGPGLSTVAAALVIGFTLALVRRQPLWTAFAAALLLAMMLHMPEPRYFLAILPVMAYGWWRGSIWLARRVPPKHAPTVLAVMLTLWFAPNAVRLGRLLLEQRSTPFIEHYHRGKWAAWRQICDDVVRQTPPDAVVLTDAAPVVRWHTGRRSLNSKLLTRLDRDAPDTLAAWRSDPPPIYLVEPARLELRTAMVHLLQVQPGSVIAEAADNPHPAYRLTLRETFPAPSLDSQTEAEPGEHVTTPAR